MKVKVHFSNIRNEIISSLERAKSNIRVAVAWLTDEDIIRALSKRSEAGVEVEVVMSDRKENFENPNNFREFFQKTSKLHVSTKVFLHHKFCIIDRNAIINGSYNWSYAARGNEENIVIYSIDEESKEDEDFLKRFEVKFRYLIDKCSVAIGDLGSLKKIRYTAKDIAVIESQMDEEEIRLRQDFEEAVKLNLAKSKSAGVSPHPNLLKRMEEDGGGVEFVKRLLRDEMISGDMKSGFRRLEEPIPHLVELSFEYLVSRQKYERLFSTEEVNFCKKLMAKYNL